MIKMLIMDVDGTLTDGRIYMGSSGEIMKAFDIKDGYAIYEMLPANGIVPVVITGRKSDIVTNRCSELGVKEVYQGCLDKKRKMKELAEKYKLSINEEGVIEECAYIGDDLLDVPGMELAGVCGCPADAADEVKNISDYISSYKGGNGAVRDFIEWLTLKNRNN